jgi:hypothetical protein
MWCCRRVLQCDHVLALAALVAERCDRGAGVAQQPALNAGSAHARATTRGAVARADLVW